MRVFPVTWQRWRSHHSIRHIRKPNAVRKLRGSIFYRTGVICYCRLKFYIAGIGNFALSAVVSLTLIRWPSYSNLTSIPSRHPRRTKMDFMPCGFRKLSHYKKTQIQARVLKMWDWKMQDLENAGPGIQIMSSTYSVSQKSSPLKLLAILG